MTGLRDQGPMRRSVLAGAAGLAALAAGARARAGDGQVATMRFAMKGLQPVTTAFVGDQGPYLMLIDSGNAVGCLLKQEIVDKLGLRQMGAGRLYGATGTDSAYAYLAHQVTFGQAVREPDVAIIGSTNTQGFDGVMPASFLAARPADMDFTTGELRIQLSGAPDRAGFRPVACEKVGRGNGAFVVNAEVEGVPARLLVDTGAATTVSLHAAFVARHGLWAEHPRFLSSKVVGVTGATRNARLVHAPLKFGPYRFPEMTALLADPGVATLGGVDGTIGIEILRRFTVGFDAGASTLWLKPNAALEQPWPYDRSGLTWEWKDGAAVVISTGVGSPAEAAGLRPGDRIVSLASKDAATAWDRRLQGPADAEVALEVEQGGARRAVSLVLKDWL